MLGQVIAGLGLMHNPKVQKLLRLLLFLFVLIAIQLLYPGDEKVILTQSDPNKEISRKIEYLQNLVKQKKQLPFSETTDSLLKIKQESKILNAAKGRVLEIMGKGIITDRSILKSAKKVEVHTKNKLIYTSPGQIIDISTARQMLLSDTILFRSPDKKLAFVELTAFFLGANLRLTPESKIHIRWIRFALFFLLLFFPALYLGALSHEKPPVWSDLIILVITGLLTILTTDLVIKSGLSPYLTILPFFAIVVNVTMDLGASLFFTTFVAIIIGIYSSFELAPFLFNMGVSWAAALSTRNFKNRYQIYWVVGLLIVLGSILTWLLLPFSSMKYWNELINLRDSTISALLSGFLVVALLPLFEKIFRISTDFLLLELSNLNNPLLRKLSTKAAGTFTHSILMGNLCEAGARAIGANPLLARVSAYYHDIGKLSAPEYFIENQLGKKNPHDDLSPEDSRKILFNHIKDGVKMAKKAGLPREIIGVIETHHGTTLIAPFYAKAKEKNPEVKEEEYRYPGPKPRNKVEALCMLADVAEAAARSLENPTSHELEDVIGKVIEDRLKDGQLDNTDLTQRDLKAIEDAFYQVLVGVFHPRIKYPAEGEKS